MAKKHKQLSDEALDLIAARFRVLAEPMRLKILHAMGEGEMSVSELVEKTGAGQANVSKHLALLLDAGIVARRKEGLNTFYRVVDDTIFDLCETVCSRLSERYSARADIIKSFSGR